MTLRILCHARACMSVGLLVALTACATGGQVSTHAPDHAARTTTDAVVVAAHPLAVDAGTAVLRRCGSAIDAAVAVQALLGLVAPQISVPGGGTIIMPYGARSGCVARYSRPDTAQPPATPATLPD